MPKLLSETIGAGDQSWIGSTAAMHDAASGVLVKAAFLAATYYPNGYIPSGTPLAKIGSGTNVGRYGPAGTRTVADAVTNSTATVTSATAAFTAGDVGAAISGSGIPANSYIGVVNSATSIGLSSSATANTAVNATASATGVSITVVDILAGFLLTDQHVPSGDALMNVAVYDHGRVNVNKLPVAFTVPTPDNGHFVFVTQS